MKGLASTKLRSFREEVLGTHIHVFGNVAAAVAACEITENDADVSRGVGMLLLVRDEGKWRIVSQAWDTENPSKPIPAFLTAGQSRAGGSEEAPL
jgi:ketosteroid isomerase-like protein